MDEQVIIKGAVEDIIFQNKENGYAVFSIVSEDDGEETVCVGTVPELHSGESLHVTGSFVVHPTYGKQLKVELFEKTIPTTEDGIERYLGSGVISGIGPKTAKKIVARFGADTFQVIEDTPERLAELKGITENKAMEIHTIFCEQYELRRAMLFLQDFGISPVYAMKIYKRYKGKTYDVVKTNPYRLADDIFGIGFKMADKLAASAGIAEDSPFRIKAAVKYLLNFYSNSGHVYLPRAFLIEKTQDMLSVNSVMIENALIELQLDHQIWQEAIDGQDVVYLNSYYYAEIAVAKKLLEIAMDYDGENSQNIEKAIAKVEQKTGISLADNQREAVKEAMTNGLLIITGGPGTGKTTTINTIIRLLEEEENEIVLAAPTGRAAKRMSEATGRDAQTIHRLLGINFINEDNRRQTYDRDENNPIDADVIIIDETSMVDIMLMYGLCRAIAPGTRLIFVGDVDQLPSVGPGNVLKDMIKSGKLLVVRLTEIFRQAQESAIVMNAHRINQGQEPMLNEKGTDFFFMRRGSQEEVVNTIVQLVTKRLPSFLSCNGLSDIQILTPMRKSLIGVYNLNGVLQNALNPPHKKKKEKEYRTIIFREGDKVMQIKNNYNIAWKIYNKMGKVSDEGLGVFNGDEGTITEIDDQNETLTVTFDDNKCVVYDYTQLEELELAYAITIHKSQGSEYPVVIIPVHSGPPMLMSRNLLYTAVTRAKRMVVLVGLQDTVHRMIQNNREVNRYSSLAYRITSLYDFMYEEESKQIPIKELPIMGDESNGK